MQNRATAILPVIIILVTVLMALSGGIAAADAPVMLINADGIWSNACGDEGCEAENVTCLLYYNTDADPTDENQVRYGDNTNSTPCPSSKDVQSGFGFDGAQNVAITPGETFLLGTFTHYNNPIYDYAGNFKQADLNITMDFQVVASGQTFSGAAAYTVHLDETPNGAQPCEYEDPECGPLGCPNQNGCCDKVWFTGSAEPQIFEIDGVWYTLEILGLVPDCQGSLIQTEYFTKEQATNTACLYGRIIVAAPSIEVTKTADPTMLPTPGGDFTFTVDVCNTGDRELTLTSLMDDKYGDITQVSGKITSTDCQTGGTIAIGECYQCSFTANEIHEEFWTQTDTVTATAVDTENHQVQDSDDATIRVKPPDTPVPTMTQWGILGMVTVLMVAAAVMLARRRHA